MKRVSLLATLPLGIGLLLVLVTLTTWTGASYAQDDHDHTPTPPPTASPEEIAHGYEVYQLNGCTACHGLNGEGMENLGPALAGHTATQITWQLRAPIGIMLVFPATQINQEDLTALIAYITSLEAVEGGHNHGTEPDPNATPNPLTPLPYARDVVVPHHWLLQQALIAEDYETAAHELEHIVALTTGTHQAAMMVVQTKLEAKDYAGALADVEAMLTDIDTTQFNVVAIYLQMAHASLVAEDTDEALDYLNHAVLLPTGQDMDLTHVLKMINLGDIAGATEHLASLLPSIAAPHQHDAGEEDHDATAEGEAGHDHPEATVEGEATHDDHEATPTPTTESAHSH